MLAIVLIMLCGIAVGLFLRNRHTRQVTSLTTVLIWLLLLLLGIEVGGNRRIVTGIQTLGAEALLLTVCGGTVTIVLTWILWQFISKKEGKK